MLASRRVFLQKFVSLGVRGMVSDGEMMELEKGI